MKIVVLNAGSGSQRCSFFDLPDGGFPTEPMEPLWEAKLDATAPGQPKGKILVRVNRDETTEDAGAVAETSSVAERTEYLLRLLWEGAATIISHPQEIAVIAHRVVHGGTEFDRAIRIDDAVEAAIERLGAMAPLHNANNLIGIRVAQRVLGNAAMAFAVFDTAFHRTLPREAATYAGPREWLEQGIRRYGFHGSSFRWASERAGQILGRENDSELRLILCHIGGGCSLCATRGGRSIDTTMGFTPLDGIAMCTRSGAVDPGILIHLLRSGKTVDELETILNKESGLKGLSGISGDSRVLLPKVRVGDSRATLAWDVFVHRLRAGIGQMLATLGDAPHAIVFTDAIGESEPALRSGACAPFAFLGLKLDESKNALSLPDTEISTPDSRVRVLIIKSRESWQIARECHAAVTEACHVCSP